MAYGGTNNRNYNNGGNRKPYNNNREFREQVRNSRTSPDVSDVCSI